MCKAVRGRGGGSKSGYVHSHKVKCLRDGAGAAVAPPVCLKVAGRAATDWQTDAEGEAEGDEEGDKSSLQCIQKGNRRWVENKVFVSHTQSNWSVKL